MTVDTISQEMAGGERNTDAILKSISPKFENSSIVRFISETFNLENVSLDPNVTLGEESKKGDSYLSTITRFSIKATGKQASGADRQVVIAVIAKTLPNNIAHRKTFRCLEFFKNEIIFYQVWATLKTFLQSKGLTDVCDYVPLCVSAVTDGANDYIAMDDLSHKGYRTVSRGSGFDINHIRLVINLFAKFHAASLAWKDQQPQAFENAVNALEETYFSEKHRSWYIGFQTKYLFPVIRDAVEKQLDPSYVKKFDELCASDFFGVQVKLAAKRTLLSLITHGDAWVPNFLFKYKDDGKTPRSSALIDFQLARPGSLAFDLTFFLYACTEQSERVRYWNEFIQLYHTAFTNTLQELGSDANLLTKDALNSEIQNNAVFGVGMAMEAIVMSLMEDDEAADLGLMLGDQAVPLESVWNIKPFKSKEKQQRIAGIIKHAVDKGFI